MVFLDKICIHQECTDMKLLGIQQLEMFVRQSKQMAAQTMGFDEEMWDADVKGPYFNALWMSLEDEQKEAVKILRRFYEEGSTNPAPDWIEHLDDPSDAEDASDSGSDSGSDAKPRKRGIKPKKRGGWCC
jgi:hypothetical protein